MTTNGQLGVDAGVQWHVSLPLIAHQSPSTTWWDRRRDGGAGCVFAGGRCCVAREDADVNVDVDVDVNVDEQTQDRDAHEVGAGDADQNC